MGTSPTSGSEGKEAEFTEKPRQREQSKSEAESLQVVAQERVEVVERTSEKLSGLSTDLHSELPRGFAAKVEKGTLTPDEAAKLGAARRLKQPELDRSERNEEQREILNAMITDTQSEALSEGSEY